jgi:hypothetical protein
MIALRKREKVKKDSSDNSSAVLTTGQQLAIAITGNSGALYFSEWFILIQIRTTRQK